MGPGTADIEHTVSDDHDPRGLDPAPGRRAGALESHRRKLVARATAVSKSAKRKVRVETERRELDARTPLPVAGQEPNERVRPRLEPQEQLTDVRQEVHLRRIEIALECVQVTFPEPRQLLFDLRWRQPGAGHQVEDDPVIGPTGELVAV